MFRFGSSNPVFRRVSKEQGVMVDTATYSGVMTKTGILFVITVLSAILSLSLIGLENLQLYIALLGVSVFTAFIGVLIGTLSVRLAKPMSILYALSEGFLLGFISLIAEMYIPGIAGLAILITLSIFGVMLMLYTTRIVKVGQKFRAFMYTVLISLFIIALVSLVLSLFGVYLFPQDNGPLAIGISVFYLLFASLMLLLDFDRIENLVNFGVDKRFEWSLALGLMVTLVWIYIQVIELAIRIAAASKD